MLLRLNMFGCTHLNANNAVFAEGTLDDGVVRQREALLVHLAEATLVHELTNSLQVGFCAKT